MNKRLQKRLLIQIELIKLIGCDFHLLDEIVNKLDYFMKKGKLWEKDEAIIGKAHINNDFIFFTIKSLEDGFIISFENKKENKKEYISIINNDLTNQKCLTSIATHNHKYTIREEYFDEENRIILDQKRIYYLPNYADTKYMSINETTTNSYYYENNLVLKKSVNAFNENDEIKFCNASYSIIDETGNVKNISSMEAYEYFDSGVPLNELFFAKEKVIDKI